jgi:hypothetical protein
MKDAQTKFRKPKAFFTFEEAIWTMRQCKIAYHAWLKKQTNGLNPKRAKLRGEWG